MKIPPIQIINQQGKIIATEKEFITIPKIGGVLLLSDARLHQVTEVVNNLKDTSPHIKIKTQYILVEDLSKILKEEEQKEDDSGFVSEIEESAESDGPNLWAIISAVFLIVWLVLVSLIVVRSFHSDVKIPMESAGSTPVGSSPNKSHDHH